MPAKCAVCGVQTENEQAFRRYYKSVREPPLYFCPTCWNLRERKTQRLGLLFTFGAIGGGLLALLVFGGDAGKALGRLGLLIVGFELSGVVLHELGHATMALLTGMRIFRISFGEGVPIYRFESGGTWWEFRDLPTAGFVEAGIRSLALARIRRCLVILGGPLVNLGLSAFAWLMAEGGFVIRQRAMDELTPWHIMAFTNSGIALMALIPLRIPIGLHGPTAVTDGLNFFLALFARRETVEGWVASTLLIDAQENLRAGDHLAAQAIVEDGLRRYPEAAALQLANGMVLMKIGELGPARDQFVELVNRDGVHPSVLYPAMSYLAACDVELGVPQLLDEADRYSREAFETHPENVEFGVVRGRVLLARGWIEKACRLFRAFMPYLPDEPSRAECACYLARAELLQLDPDACRRNLELARRFDSGCPLIEKVERELALHPTSSSAPPAAADDFGDDVEIEGLYS